jgi:hypothetical protein
VTSKFTSVTAENPLKDFPSPIVFNIVSCNYIPSTPYLGARIREYSKMPSGMYSNYPKH